MKTSADFYKELNTMGNEVTTSIISLMRKNNITVADLTLDKEGRGYGDEDYDEDFVMDNKAWATCEEKYGASFGWITKVEIVSDNEIQLSAENEFGTEYDDSFIFRTEGMLVDILKMLEMRYHSQS